MNSIIEEAMALQTQLEETSPSRELSVAQAGYEFDKAEKAFKDVQQELNRNYDAYWDMREDKDEALYNGDLRTAKQLSVEMVDVEYDLFRAEKAFEELQKELDAARTAHVDAGLKSAKESFAMVFGFVQNMLDESGKKEEILAEHKDDIEFIETRQNELNNLIGGLDLDLSVPK